MGVCQSLNLSVAIPTFYRESVLLETISQLLMQSPAAVEILVLDQTPVHEAATEQQLADWHATNQIRWLRLTAPSQPGALNTALREATGELVLFLDDDIRVDPGFLEAHRQAFRNEEIWAVAGQVLQPGEIPDVHYLHQPSSGPFVDCDFLFRSAVPAVIENGMSGNLSVRRDRALQIGGFDENFLPPVAYRFDNDFCKRLCRAGGKIQFEPLARIYHLRAARGGTRSNSNHLTSSSPEHGVGDYYFAMRQSVGVAKWRYIVRRLFREVRTRFHLRNPWWIPVKLLGELRAIRLARHLMRRGPVLMNSCTANDSDSP